MISPVAKNLVATNKPVAISNRLETNISKKGKLATSKGKKNA